MPSLALGLATEKAMMRVMNAQSQETIVHPDSVKIAKYIAVARKKSGLSQIDMSKKTGISVRTYQRVEAGKTSPKLDVFFVILNALNINTLDSFAQIFSDRSGH